MRTNQSRNQEPCQFHSCATNMYVRLDKFIWRSIYIHPKATSQPAQSFFSDLEGFFFFFFWLENHLRTVWHHKCVDGVIKGVFLLSLKSTSKSRMTMGKPMKALSSFSSVYISLFAGRADALGELAWVCGVRLIINASERYFTVLNRGSFRFRPTHLYVWCIQEVLYCVWVGRLWM